MVHNILEQRGRLPPKQTKHRKEALIMATKKVGALIKEARTKAKLTQEQLANKVTGCNASDISKAERDEKQLTQDQLKQIAKATGVTQSSLLGTGKTSSSSSSSGTLKLSAEEKKIINLYRSADEKTKKATLELLEEGAEETGSLLSSILGGGSGAGSLLTSLLGGGSASNKPGASLLTTLLGGGSGNSGSSGGSILTSLLGGMLGGKRDMPQGGENDGMIDLAVCPDPEEGK